MAKQFGLGRGLDALMPEPPLPESGAQAGAPLSLPLGRLRPNPDQPRRDFPQESLSELADSIREHGIIQPILVEEDGAGGYLIVAGERRWRAAQMAGLREVPVILRAYTDKDRLEVAIIENIQREDLNPVEEAEAYRRLMELSGAPQEEVAKRVGKNRSTVANALRLLKLPPECLESLRQGELSPGHARAILAVVNPADQEILRRRIAEQGLSVRQAEDQARALNAGQRAASPKAGKAGARTSASGSVDIADLEQRLIQTLGTKVRLAGSASKGRIVIEYYSRDELDRLIETLLPGSGGT